MKNNNLFKLFKNQKPTAGYTLIELLIGASISVVVIGAAGMGLMNLMRGNLAATNQAERREEVNRALEFISDEVRKAEGIEAAPSSSLPSGFTSTGKEVVLALDVPDLGQRDPNDRVIYYVRPKENNKWLGPNVIYRYGPPLDTTTGRYTGGAWVEQPLIDRVNDQTFTPTCTGSETTIAAQGFAACVNTASQKIAKVYVNGKFSDSSSDEYKADIQVFARAEAPNLNAKPSKVNFGINTASGTSKVKILASNMGCSSDIAEYNSGGGTCTITTDIKQTDDTLIETINSGDSEKAINVGTNSPFKVVITPSVAGLSSPFKSYFGTSGTDPYDATGDQNNSKPIEVEIDLRKDYLNDDTVVQLVGTDFSPYQVQLLGDKSKLSDLEAWNLDGIPDASKFAKLGTVLQNNNLLDSDGEVKLKPNQYILVFEVGQVYNNAPTEDINGDGTIDIKDQHKGYDLQDHVVLLTVD